MSKVHIDYFFLHEVRVQIKSEITNFYRCFVTRSKFYLCRLHCGLAPNYLLHQVLWLNIKLPTDVWRTRRFLFSFFFILRFPPFVFNSFIAKIIGFEGRILWTEKINAHKLQSDQMARFQYINFSEIRSTDRRRYYIENIIYTKTHRNFEKLRSATKKKKKKIENIIIYINVVCRVMAASIR